MQSGIKASQELLSEFNNLLKDDSIFGLTATIERESVKPVATLPSTSPDFNANLPGLAPHIKPDEPLYIILRRYDTAPRLLFVKYVPDTAKVLKKTLFGATMISLVRELGSEHFRSTHEFNLPRELTAAGFDEVDAHASTPAPLTEEERTLGDVKRAEAEAGSGMRSRQVVQGNHMSLSASDDALQALREFSKNDGRTLVIFSLDEEKSLQLEPDTPSPTTLPEALQAIPTVGPRYSFFRYRPDHPEANQEDGHVLFLFTRPPTEGIKARTMTMAYPLYKASVRAMAEKELGCAITSGQNHEEDFPNDIKEEVVIEKLFPPKQSTNLRIRKPAGPGRSSRAVR